MERNAVSNYTLTIFIFNVRPLTKHVNNIVHDYRCLKNDAIGFIEMNPSGFKSIVDDTLIEF